VSAPPPVRVLIVEDEALVALDVEDQLRRLGYEVAGVADTEETALAAARASRPDLVLMDVQLRGGSDGVAAAARLRAEADVPVVFLTAFADTTSLERAKAVAPHGFVLKPFDERDLRTALEIALHRDRLEREVRRFQGHLLSVLDAQRAAILLLDAAGAVLFANLAARRMAGGGPVPAGVPWWDALGFARASREPIASLLRTPETARDKLTARVAGPDREWVVEVEVEDDPRDPAQRIVLLHDVSELYDLRALLSDRSSFHEIVGRSAAIARVIEVVAQVARVDVPVLVLGETGTGKELVARAIHRESARRDGPFVAVNCAGLSEDLAASQLFGHRRGAFTGAIADHRGVFEAASGGTLFLDEIGDLAPRIQTTLLRVLEERRVTRLGDTNPRPVDVRIVAATNRDLAQDAADGRFRADLLYRIRVGRVNLPSLRERREDVWLLVRHVLAEHRALTGKAVERVSDAAMRALLAYGWPGNVRELKNALGYAAIHCFGSEIDLADLPPEVRTGAAAAGADEAPAADERARIERALARTGGERKAAAALLGISRATLYRKLAQLGIG